MLLRLVAVATLGGLAGVVILLITSRAPITLLNLLLSVLAFLPVGIYLFLGWIVHGFRDADHDHR